jgi:hypothetical protein
MILPAHAGIFLRLNRLSMTDLLTTEEQAIARTQGWELAHVFDLRTNRLTVDVLAAGTHAKIKNSETATRFVVALARVNGNKLAQRALHLVTTSRQTKRAKKP